MGPAMHAMAEILNDVQQMWLTAGIGFVVVTIVLALAVGAIRRSTRRLRDRRSNGQICKAFAEAVACGDLEAAEVLATLAFARDARGGRPNEATGPATSPMLRGDVPSESCDMPPTRAPR